MKKLILLATILTLAGCSMNKVYVKPGASSQDFERDKWECQAQAGQISGGTGAYADPFLVRSLTMQCLEVRGWTLQDKS